MQTLIKPALHRRASLIYAYEWGADWVHREVLVTIEGGPMLGLWPRPGRPAATPCCWPIRTYLGAA